MKCLFLLKWSWRIFWHQCDVNREQGTRNREQGIGNRDLTPFPLRGLPLRQRENIIGNREVRRINFLGEIESYRYEEDNIYIVCCVAFGVVCSK